MSSILVIGDSHIEPDQDLSRFELLGNLIKNKIPDYIIIMGDFLTLESLSYHIQKKRLYLEGLRYNKEIQTGNKCLDIIDKSIKDLQKTRRKYKKSLYKPIKIFIKGNHEDRLFRFLESSPEWIGRIGIEQDLKLEERDYEIIPYKEYKNIDGIDFTHIPFNKSKPVSSVNICKSVAALTVNSIVFGHTHEFNCYCEQLHGMENLRTILNCGCFFEHDPDYIHGKVKHYWRGLMILETHGNGKFDLETYSLEKLRGLYEKRI